MQIPQKLCPVCQRATGISEQACAGCGHPFRTQFVQPPQTQMFLPQPNLQPPPSPPLAPLAPVPTNDAGTITAFTVASVALALLSLVLLPPILGACAAACGYRVKKAGNDGLGVFLMIFSIAIMLIGMVYGALVGVAHHY